MIDFAECLSCGSEFTNEEYMDVIACVHHMICECGCYFTVPIAPSNNGFYLTAAPVGLWNDESNDGAAAGEANR